MSLSLHLHPHVVFLRFYGMAKRNLRKLLLTELLCWWETDQKNTRVLKHGKQELYKTVVMGHAADCWVQTERGSE